MGIEAAIRGHAKVLAGTRPRIPLRRLDHRGAHRVQLDVAIDSQHISFRVDQARLEPAFPKCPGTAVSSVERADIALIEQPHRIGEIAGVRGRDEQMDVIAHQNPGMHIQTMGRGDLEEKIAVTQAVFIVDERRTSIDATLRDMKWHSREKQAGTARH